MAEKDIPAVAALLTGAFAAPGYSALQRAIVRAETAAGLAERRGASLLLVAEREGAVVGSVEAFTPEFLRGKQARGRDTLTTCPRHVHDTSTTRPRHAHDTPTTRPRHAHDTPTTRPRHVPTPATWHVPQLRFWSASLPLESYVSALATAPSARRSGVGRTLMSRVEAIVWEAGESVLSLQV